MGVFILACNLHFWQFGQLGLWATLALDDLNFEQLGLRQYLISGFQNHLQTKSDFLISVCRTQFKRHPVYIS